MIKNTSLDALQRKLGTFLSLVYGAGLSLDVMDDVLYKSRYFDFLEDNKADDFLDDSFDDIIEKAFGIKLRLNENGDVNTALFWAGFSYIDLAIRMKKPLRQLFLLCPPSKMLSLFEPYHEMSETALCDYFQNEIYKKSILKTLLEKRKMSVPSLSYFCGCSVPLVWSYCVSNEHLFAASERMISSLMDALGVSSSFFKEKSSFVYYSPSFLLDSGFIDLLGESLKNILRLKKVERPFVYVGQNEDASSLSNKGKTAIMVTYLPLEPKAIKDILSCFKSLLVAGAISICYEAGPKAIKKKMLNQDLVDLAFKYACQKNTLM